MDRWKKFLLTPFPDKTLNKWTAFLFLLLSVMGVLFSLFIKTVPPEQFKYPISPEFNTFFNTDLIPYIHHYINILFFLSLSGIVISFGMLKRSSWGYFTFLLLNGIIIGTSVYNQFLTNKLIDSFFRVLNLYLPELSETSKLKFQFQIAAGGELVIIFLFHIWLIWRYLHPNMKNLFFKKTN